MKRQVQDRLRVVIPAQVAVLLERGQYPYNLSTANSLDFLHISSRIQLQGHFCWLYYVM